jgi:hypothetical protein
MVNPKCGVLIEEMECLLKTWLYDQTQKYIPVSQAIISTKARNLYDDLKKCIGESVTDETSFSASHGWFDRFKRRVNLHNLKLSGEAASAGNDTALTYPAQLAQLIE